MNISYKSECFNIFHQVCRKIDSCPDGTGVLERIFEGLNVYYNYTGSVDCFNLDDDPHGENGWNWQVFKQWHTEFLCLFFSLFSP